jgi:hypothetical protein
LTQSTQQLLAFWFIPKDGVSGSQPHILLPLRPQFVQVSACGNQITLAEPDPIVELNPTDFGNGSACGRNIRVNCQSPAPSYISIKLTVVSDQNLSVTVNVIDVCSVCATGGISLSRDWFLKLADVRLGTIPVEWDFV